MKLFYKTGQTTLSLDSIFVTNKSFHVVISKKGTNKKIYKKLRKNLHSRGKSVILGELRLYNSIKGTKSLSIIAPEQAGAIKNITQGWNRYGGW
jgi:molybdate-binding protein